MQYKSIFIKHTYQHNGQEQTSWYKVGYLKSTPNGGQYIRLFQSPDVAFYIFNDPEENLPEIQLNKEEEREEK